MDLLNPTEENPQERLRLKTELDALKSFLSSPGYLAGKAIVDQSLTDATNLIYDLDPSDPAYVAKLYQTIGQGRAYRNWSAPFEDRLAELEQLLGERLEEEKD